SSGDIVSAVREAIAGLTIAPKIVNAIDSGSFVSEALDTTVGQQAVLNFMRANRNAVLSAIGAKR
ncbi:hypothetical protein, partial [Pseudomonas sp. PM2]|uniref:hypothetical protein n=1 Tax=Pseudomonas sp. PM2 TaxID=215172 RepID=UPI003FA2C335